MTNSPESRDPQNTADESAHQGLVIAHTPEGPVVFRAAAEVPPRDVRRQARRRRLGLAGALGAFALATALAVGTAAYASHEADAASAAADTSGAATAVVDGNALPYGSGSGTSGSGYGYGYLYGGGSSSSGGSSSGGSSSTGTATTGSAVAASTAQTAGVVTIVSDLSYQSAQSAGTGIILTSDGLILTNNHVIEGSTSIEVTDEITGAAYSATVVGTDATHDIAVLQLKDASGLTTASLGDSDSVTTGQAVTAVGNAQGTGDLVAASGTVTALDQTITTQSEYGIAGETLNGLIQVNADIVSGDSGGPLKDASGDVVGIDTAASSGSAQVTGFAIPINTALDIVAQIEQGVDTSTIEIGYPGFLGVSVAQSTTGTSGSAYGSGSSSAYGSRSSGSTASSGAGALIAGVIAGTPAADAGLAAGDTITSVNGTAVASGAALSALLATMEPGETVTLAWTTAAGATTSATITLIAGPAA